MWNNDDESKEIDDLFFMNTKDCDLAEAMEQMMTKEEESHYDEEHSIRQVKKILSYVNYDQVRKQKNKKGPVWYSRMNRLSKIAVIFLCCIAFSSTLIISASVAERLRKKQIIPGVGIVDLSGEIKPSPIPTIKEVTYDSLAEKDKNYLVLNGTYHIEMRGYQVEVLAANYDGHSLILNVQSDLISNNTGDEQDCEYLKMSVVKMSGGSVSIGDEGCFYFDIDYFQQQEEFYLSSLENCYLVFDHRKIQDNQDLLVKEKVIMIPLDNIPLEKAKTVTSIDELGNVVEQYGIKIAAISNYSDNLQTFSIVSECENVHETVNGVGNFTRASAISDIPKFINIEGDIYYAVNDQTSNSLWSILQFNTSKEEQGVLSFSYIGLEKQINLNIALPVPQEGETISINQTYEIDGLEVTVIDVSRDIYEQDRMIPLVVHVQAKQGIFSNRIVGEYSLGEGVYNTVNGTNYSGASDCPDKKMKSYYFEDPIDFETFSFSIDHIYVTVYGNWEIPIVPDSK